MSSGHCTIKAAARAAALVNASAVAVEDAQEPNLIPFGIAVGLAASVLINIAQNQLARGKQRGFWIGVFALSAISNFVAFGFAPGSVLSPLEGAQFVTNLMFHLIDRNPALLKKGSLTPYGKRVVLGTLLVLLGVVLPVIGGSGAAPAKFDEQTIECMWSRPLSIVYLATCLAVALSCLGAWRCLRTEKYERSDEMRRYDDLIVQDIWRKYGCESKATMREAREAVAAYRRHVRDEQIDERWYSLALYGLGAALIGGLAVVQAKVISELIEILFADGTDILTRPLIWVQSVLVAVLFVAWLQLLDRAPGYFQQVAAIPTLQGGYIVFASIGPGIFLEELVQLSTTNLALFFVGMFLIAAGVSSMISAGKPETGIYNAPTFWRGISTMTWDEKTGRWTRTDMWPSLPKNLVLARSQAQQEKNPEAYAKAREDYENFLAKQLREKLEENKSRDPSQYFKDNENPFVLQKQDATALCAAVKHAGKRGRPSRVTETVPLLLSVSRM